MLGLIKSLGNNKLGTATCFNRVHSISLWTPGTPMRLVRYLQPGARPSKRVCDKSESGWFQPFEHQMDHRNMNPSFSCFRQFLVVLAEPSAPADSSQRALHHPPAGQHLEPEAVRATAHHTQEPAAGGPSPRYQSPGVGRIGPDYLEPRESAQQFGQHQFGSIPVLDVGGMNHHVQEQSSGVHYDVALASRHPLARVIAARPPFSVVFTDWLSMMAPLGVASRPSGSRTMGRSASSTCCQVPSVRHFLKYHQTVPQGGGRGASFARVCRRAARTESRLPPPAGSRFWDAPWMNPGAARDQASSTGHRSNQWDTLFDPYPKLTDPGQVAPS